jgi:hypothetical protein
VVDPEYQTSSSDPSKKSREDKLKIRTSLKKSTKCRFINYFTPYPLGPAAHQVS